MKVKIKNILGIIYISCIAILTTFQTATAVEPKKNTFTPPFNGLHNGTELTDGCTIFKNYSVKMTYIDIDYQFEIYEGSSCSETSRTYKGKLPAEAMLAGEWNKLIVIDNGTGPDSRSLSLIKPKTGNTLSDIDYAVEPTFSEHQIEYYIATDQKATLEDCPEQKEEFNEWKNFGLGIGLARKEVFTLTSGKKTLPDEYACFGMQ